MGVLRFAAWLFSKYPQCLHQLNGSYEECQTLTSLNISTDCLELDLNAIFHPVAQKIYSSGTKQPISFLKPRQPKPPKEYNELELFTAICERINNIKNIIQPKKEIYCAVDGVSGFSKCLQQAKRRYKSAHEKKNNITNNDNKLLWDSNQISCGTEFMERLSIFIKNYIQRQIKDKWKGLKVIFNSHRIVGEGEHKLIAHMRSNPQYSFTVISPDADLIFLAAGLHNPNIYIFRENMYNISDGDFFLINVGEFRKCILSEIKIDLNRPSEQLNNIMEDFIVYLFFFGNDFLPQIPSLYITDDGIEVIFRLYPEIFHKYGFLTGKDKNGFYSLNKQAFTELLLILSKNESNNILNHYLKNSKCKYPDHLLSKHVRLGKSQESDEHKTFQLNFQAYKNEYYKEKFHDVNIELICHEYLKGMIFVLRYYLDKIPSAEWSYPFLYGPLLTDLAQYIQTFDVDIKFTNSTFLRPLEQLLSVLPPQSSYLLPKALQPLSTSIDSPIIDMFPTEFQMDLEGKSQEYEAIVHLPHIDLARLRKAFNEVENNLTNEENERNTSEDIIIYK